MGAVQAAWQATAAHKRYLVDAASCSACPPAASSRRRRQHAAPASGCQRRRRGRLLAGSAAAGDAPDPAEASEGLEEMQRQFQLAAARSSALEDYRYWVGGGWGRQSLVPLLACGCRFHPLPSATDTPLTCPDA